MRSLVMLTPALLTNGGNKELLALGRRLQAQGIQVSIISLWEFTDRLDTTGFDSFSLAQGTRSKWHALTQLPSIVWRFAKHRSSLQDKHVVFTHYSTYLLSWFIRRTQQVFFLQDLEWNFIRAQWLRAVLKRYILSTLRGNALITANGFLSKSYKALVPDAAIIEYPIWASRLFDNSSSANQKRPIDLIFVSRRGFHKRLDMYEQVIADLKTTRSDLVIAAITPQPDTLSNLKDFIDSSHLFPSMAEMRDLYSQAKVFVLLSEYEGFALPPLEAMGSGCVAICRDNGGSSNYLYGSLSRLLISSDTAPERIAKKILDLLNQPHLLHQLSIECAERFRDGLSRSEHLQQEGAAQIAASLRAPE
jgi:glycosyltransferase involved in cell wall biosynthesis